MIVLDTNVISEMMRLAPDPVAKGWLDSQPEETIYTTAVCEAELRFGIAILPDGRRKRGFEDEAAAFFSDDMISRVLPFDRAAALEYSVMAAGLRAAGRGFATADVQIAAIARAHGFALATRNVRDFAGCGVEVIDPFAGG